jgi:hypothetical protein
MPTDCPVVRSNFASRAARTSVSSPSTLPPGGPVAAGDVHRRRVARGRPEFDYAQPAVRRSSTQLLVVNDPNHQNASPWSSPTTRPFGLVPGSEAELTVWPPGTGVLTGSGIARSNTRHAQPAGQPAAWTSIPRSSLTRNPQLRSLPRHIGSSVSDGLGSSLTISGRAGCSATVPAPVRMSRVPGNFGGAPVTTRPRCGRRQPDRDGADVALPIHLALLLSVLDEAWDLQVKGIGAGRRIEIVRRRRKLSGQRLYPCSRRPRPFRSRQDDADP